MKHFVCAATHCSYTGKCKVRKHHYRDKKTGRWIKCLMSGLSVQTYARIKLELETMYL